MSPDQINALHGRVCYICRACGATSGLHWFGGTSCPVCSKPECSAALSTEVANAIAADVADQAAWNERYGQPQELDL